MCDEDAGEFQRNGKQRRENQHQGNFPVIFEVRASDGIEHDRVGFVSGNISIIFPFFTN